MKNLAPMSVAKVRAESVRAANSKWPPSVISKIIFWMVWPTILHSISFLSFWGSRNSNLMLFWWFDLYLTFKFKMADFLHFQNYLLNGLAYSFAQYKIFSLFRVKEFKYDIVLVIWPKFDLQIQNGHQYLLLNDHVFPDISCISMILVPKMQFSVMPDSMGYISWHLKVKVIHLLSRSRL